MSHHILFKRDRDGLYTPTIQTGERKLMLGSRATETALKVFAVDVLNGADVLLVDLVQPHPIRSEDA